jgi:hypothetical protein
MMRVKSIDTAKAENMEILRAIVMEVIRLSRMDKVTKRFNQIVHIGALIKKLAEKLVQNTQILLKTAVFIVSEMVKFSYFKLIVFTHKN